MASAFKKVLKKKQEQAVQENLDLAPELTESDEEPVEKELEIASEEEDKAPKPKVN